jgi:hypothetical protein
MNTASIIRKFRAEQREGATWTLKWISSQGISPDTGQESDEKKNKFVQRASSLSQGSSCEWKQAEPPERTATRNLYEVCSHDVIYNFWPKCADNTIKKMLWNLSCLLLGQIKYSEPLGVCTVCEMGGPAKFQSYQVRFGITVKSPGIRPMKVGRKFHYPKRSKK